MLGAYRCGGYVAEGVCVSEKLQHVRHDFFVDDREFGKSWKLALASAWEKKIG